MIRQMFTDMSEAELAAAKPDPTAQLVSMGEHTKFETEYTKHGARQVVVTFEVLVEWKFCGGGRRVWYRFKDRPNELVPQFDVTPAPPPVPVEEYSAEEQAAMRAMLPPRDPPVPNTSTPLTVAPNW
jgi:hypothetical protein